MRTLLTSFVCLAAACAGASPTPQEAARPAPSFQNPGGMWLPWQLADRADLLRSLGLTLDVAKLSDPSAAPLAAIVSVGGCSASFVSPDGLVMTNYHCVQRALQTHSTAEDNIAEKGFLAATRADEKSNGPTSRVYVNQGFTDVTERILEDLSSVKDPRQRYDLIETREKELVSVCEKDRPGIRCTVRSYYRGAQYYLIEKLALRDIRLVYAPARDVGLFGGDEDNWMWPRHSGDYAFYRAYVSPDGKPADFAAENVPYQPAHHLRVATEPLRPGDFVMVAGFPGRTHRHRTAAEVAEAVEFYYPRSIAALEEQIEVLQGLARQSKELGIKAGPRIMGWQNRLKKNRGTVKGLTDGQLLLRKQKLEQELTAWIDAEDSRRIRFGTVLAELRRLDEEEKRTRDRDLDMGGLRLSALLGTARLLVRMAEERPKPDAERDPWMQERNWKRLEGWQRTFAKRYHRTIDETMMITGLTRAARNPDRNRDWLVLVLGEEAQSGPISDALIARVVRAMYETSGLEDEALRLSLLRTGTVESLTASDDPFIQLALRLSPLEHEQEARDKRHSGAMAALLPEYMAALRGFHDGAMAPDANGTLRITYGTVRGYRATPEAEMYHPFTTLAQMAAKHRGTSPFDVPADLLAAAQNGPRGSYVDSELGDIPVNFLSDLDITGGNSGSATLNGRGELVGLAFDTNLEAVASDWLFMDAYNRTIHVDIRYTLWIMDAVHKAHRLMLEMGVKPQFAGDAPVTTAERTPISP